VCDTRSSSEDEDVRYLYKETQFALAVVKAGFTNTPPTFIGPAEVVLEEDSGNSKVAKCYVYMCSLKLVIGLKYCFKRPLNPPKTKTN